MAEIVNLRIVRKRKAREEKSELAAQNRILFGRTKGEKDLAKAKAEQDAKRLDGHKLGDAE
jgi:hypothetical protein